MSEPAQQKPGWPAMSLREAHAFLTAPNSRFALEEVIIRGVPTRCWKHAPPTLAQVLATGRLYGNRDFLVYEDERVSFESFWRASSAVAAELKSRGVEKGDRVAIIMRNLPEWAAAFYGAAVIGAIVTPLNAWWTGSELEYGLVDSGSRSWIRSDSSVSPNISSIARHWNESMSAVTPMTCRTRLLHVSRMSSAPSMRGPLCRTGGRQTYSSILTMMRLSCTLLAQQENRKVRSARTAT
jgi:non-ribosomal peptide synthetase component E (peptide arylation enzyme)